MMKFAIIVCLVMISGVFSDSLVELENTKEIGSEETRTAREIFTGPVSFEMKKLSLIKEHLDFTKYQMVINQKHYKQTVI